VAVTNKWFFVRNGANPGSFSRASSWRFTSARPARICVEVTCGEVEWRALRSRPDFAGRRDPDPGKLFGYRLLGYDLIMSLATKG